MNDVLQAISTVGFPIVMCGALFYKMNEQDKAHKEESKKLVEAINNNTIALTKLSERVNFD